ncbi:cytochrome-c peroxidase [Nitrosococcus oceani]|uniref:cytochrome-c peroxidase n=1 Tax=Nitrosococcus oceani TaxID=1229 RepID=UPI0004E8A4CF|nr:cytochrome c peroxidase [Nitrosococcus oceani]KFI21651.1 cytochrome C peroxidase [Nitrosococcus oceani]
MFRSHDSYEKAFCYRLLLALSLFSVVASLGAEGGKEPILLEQAKQFFKPLPETMATAEFPTPPERVSLGKRLFFDPRLSADGMISCATCHRPALYGTDALPRSIGVEHRVNPRNAPTVLNAALQDWQHWRGDRANVEEQASKSVLGHGSFGNPNEEAVLAKLRALGYTPAFQSAFPEANEPLTLENFGKAIGAYERTLVSPSPFDNYLKGNTEALGPQAKKGLGTFIKTGCIACHNGTGVGGQALRKFGIKKNYWQATGSEVVDEGRYSITQNQTDKYVFKVPSLRNVAMTPPYFHDGSVTTLPKAIRIMAQVQLGKTLSQQQIKAIMVFLNSLTGELPADFQQAPLLPPKAFNALP